MMMVRNELFWAVLCGVCLTLACKKSDPPTPAAPAQVAQPQKEAPAVPAEQGVKSLQEATAPKTLEGLPRTRVNKSVPSILQERIVPNEAGVRRWILQNRSALVTEVKLQKVSLDADSHDEYLATIPFGTKAGESYDWILLIDGQGKYSVVVKDWTRRKVDTKAKVVAHGKGGNPVLVVTVAHENRSSVEVWRMAAAGNVSSLGSFGTEVGEKARFEAPKTIVVARDGGTEERIVLVTGEKDFELVSSTPQ
jgi:hypothetical protein